MLNSLLQNFYGATGTAQCFPKWYRCNLTKFEYKFAYEINRSLFFNIWGNLKWLLMYISLSATSRNDKHNKKWLSLFENASSW